MSWPFTYTGNLPWLTERTILLVDHGSRAYGTHRPDSDFDFKGVAVAPRSYRDGFLHNFHQAEIKEGADAVIFSLPKFMSLAADCNPTLIEVLWIDDQGVRVNTPAGELLREHRKDFLSKKALHTFRGYAIQQLRRIEGHRKWLLEPPKKKPEREDFGLLPRAEVPTNQITAALSEIRTRMDGWSIDFGDLDYSERLKIREQVEQYLAELSIGREEEFQAAARLCGLEENFIELLTRERRYEAALAHWKSYQTWKTERNEARAELEAKYGYDTKHGMHLVRLMRMCREILQDQVVHVRRPDAEELLAIRNGAWPYDQLMEWARREDADLKEVALKSDLPKMPDRVKLDQLCQKITGMLDS